MGPLKSMEVSFGERRVEIVATKNYSGLAGSIDKPGKKEVTSWLWAVHMLIKDIEELERLLSPSKKNPKVLFGNTDDIIPLFVNLRHLVKKLTEQGEKLSQIMIADEVDSKLKSMLLDFNFKQKGNKRS